MRPAAEAAPAAPGPSLRGHAALLVLAAFVYLYGLGGHHIPRNGDEDVYAHITRVTAASGRLLPLQSQLDGMRNTKPPLLFWQGIAATGWGRDWSLWRLRCPSVVYTLLTALLVLVTARNLSGRTATGIKAALAFLAFFSTYRYGRPFLTDPALIFWLGLPFFTLIWRPASFDSRVAVPLLAGLAFGIGLLYKSFALVVPVCFAMSWWHLHLRGYRIKDFLVRDSGKIAVSGVAALLLFGLWFAVDPDPAAVWKEFVVGENLGKIDPHGPGYVATLLRGKYSIWNFALASLGNAGLLIFPIGGLCVASLARRAQLTPGKALLWIWIVAFAVFFSLPSQRSARYLMPVMPALAVLLALEWDQLRRWLFAATLAVSGVLFAVAGHLAFRLNAELEAPLYGWPFWLLLAASGALVPAGLFVRRATRILGVAAALSVYLVFSAFMQPLDGRLGSYPAQVLGQLQGRDVWVPCNFRAREESSRFVLPGATVHGYRLGLKLDAARLAERYPTFAIQVPIAADPASILHAAGPRSRILGERLELRSRHSGRELRRMLLEGELFELWFVRELLIESPGAPRDAVARWATDGCR